MGEFVFFLRFLMNNTIVKEEPIITIADKGITVARKVEVAITSVLGVLANNAVYEVVPETVSTIGDQPTNSYVYCASSVLVGVTFSPSFS